MLKDLWERVWVSLWSCFDSSTNTVICKSAQVRNSHFFLVSRCLHTIYQKMLYQRALRCSGKFMLPVPNKKWALDARVSFPAMNCKTAMNSQQVTKWGEHCKEKWLQDTFHHTVNFWRLRIHVQFCKLPFGIFTFKLLNVKVHMLLKCQFRFWLTSLPECAQCHSDIASPLVRCPLISFKSRPPENLT